MSRSDWPISGHRIIPHWAERLSPKGFRCVLVSAGSIIVLAVGFSSVQPVTLRAGDQPPAGSTPHADAVQSPSGFVAESRATLKRLQETMAGLAARALEGLDMNNPTEADMAIQTLTVESAKAGYQHALLVREAAEIALKEYQEAEFKQKKRSCETEIKLAQLELESAERTIPQAKERFAKFKRVKTGSAGDISREWSFEAGEVTARFQAQKAKFVLEQAQSKLKVLVEYEKQKNDRELMSSIEKARSDELARKATWQLEQSKLMKLQKMQDPARRSAELTDQRKRMLTLLDRAIPIEEQLSARLDQIKEDSHPGDSQCSEITNLTRQLQRIVDQAHGEEASADLARLKWNLRRASNR
jgi:hypothetical protein